MNAGMVRGYTKQVAKRPKWDHHSTLNLNIRADRLFILLPALLPNLRGSPRPSSERSMFKNLISALLLTSAGVFSATQGVAQSLPPPNQSNANGWRHTLGIYMFAPIRTWGDSTINGNTTSLDMSLRDILDLLNFAASGRFESWKGNFGIILDANYASIGSQGTLPSGSAVDFESRQKWFGILGAYRVAQGTYGDGSEQFSIDIQGGARWNSIKQEVRVTPPGTLAGGDEGWVEPVIGIRGAWRLNDKWTTIASADLGGFGVGGNDLQASVNLGFDYQLKKNTALTFGYRYFSVDYSTMQAGGLFAYDVEQHGPYFGVKFFF